MVGGKAIFGSPPNLSALGVSAQETVDVCGKERAINSQEFGAESFASVVGKLTSNLASNSVQLAPIGECE
jgi:hypothetical protein